MKIFYFLPICLLLLNSCRNKKMQENSLEYNADDYYNKGVMEYENRNYIESLENYEKAISMDSTISDYYHNRGVVKEIMSDTTGALKDYEKSILLDRENVFAYNNIGCILSAQGNDTDAVKLYETCIVIDPDYYPAYYNCAYSQYKIKNYKDALRNFEKIITIYDEGQKAHAYYYMGLIYKETGEIENAREYLEKASALGNKDAEEELKTIFEQ